MVVIGFVAVCSASPSLYLNVPQHYPTAVISPIKSQYHTQNELGQYTYGYNDGYSSKSETKHANGLTEGAYSYVDPNGVLQQYNYVSDENGYRVTGTNLPVAPAFPVVAVSSETPAAVVAPADPVTAVPAVPVNDAELPKQVEDTPEVAAAKAAHQIAYDEAKKAAEAAPTEDDPSSEVVTAAVSIESASAAPAVTVASPVVATTYHGYRPAAYAAYPSYTVAAPAPIASYAYASARPYAAYAPAPSYAYAPAPSYAYAPYAVPYTVGSYSPVHSQYHSQDELGQYSYGYNSGSSSKAEVKTLDGVTRGGYSYVDSNGIYQQYQYVSDPVNGFRVSGTNLPSNSL